VLVDLLRSGARALLLTRLAFAGAAAICRPAPLQAAAGFLIALVSALAANILRITVLPWFAFVLGPIALSLFAGPDPVALFARALVPRFAMRVGSVPTQVGARMDGSPEERRLSARRPSLDSRGRLIESLCSSAGSMCWEKG